MKKILIATLAGLLLFTGCSQIPKLENGKDAVVSLEEGAISVDDLYEEMKNKYALSVLIDMVDTKILDEKYKETDEEVKYIEEAKESDELYWSLLYKKSYPTFESYLRARYGVDTVEEAEEIYRLGYRRNEAIKEYAKGLITDSEIEKYYEDELIADIEASHILITADYTDSATDEEKEAAKVAAFEKAKEIIKELNDGKDFATLAKEYSKDGNADKGGALGRIGHGDVEASFEAAANKLEVGKYTTEPVETRFGYHIILKTKEYEKDPLEDVKDEIIDTLTDRKINSSETLSYEALDELRKDSGMSIEDSALNTQYENYIYNTTN